MKIYILVILVAVMSCNDQINKNSSGNSGAISGTVDYQGSRKPVRLGFALFAESDYPPTTRPPVATLVLPETAAGPISFPIEYELPDIPFGTYFLEVYGDVDMNDTEHGPNMLVDPFVHGAGPLVVGPTAPEVVHDLKLQDPDPETDAISEVDAGQDVWADDVSDSVGPGDSITPLDIQVLPEPGKAALFGSVVWEGEASGTLIIAGFGSNPPTGPPVLFESFAEVNYPFFYQLTDIKPGVYHVIVYLDKNMQDGMGNHPIDPVSEGFRKVTLVADQSHLEDFVLSIVR